MDTIGVEGSVEMRRQCRNTKMVIPILLSWC